MRDLIIKHRIFFGIIILLIVLTIPLTVIQVQQQQTLKQRANSGTTTSVSVALDPPSKNLSIDENEGIVPVKILINNPNGLNISAADITLAYPTNLLSYVSESFQPAGGNFTSVTTQSGNGTFRFAVVSLTDASIVDEAIDVGTLKFKALGAGEAKITFSAVTITASAPGQDDLTVIPPTETYTYTISDAQRSDTASSSPTKYPLCWGGSRDVPALTGCQLNITDGASCSSSEYRKCLSVNRISGAEKIDGKYLTCCNASEYGFTGKNSECTLVVDGEFSDQGCSDPIIAGTPTLTIGSGPNSPKNILNFSFGKFGPGETVTIKYDNTRSATVTADSDGAGAGSIWIPAAGSYTLTATGENPQKKATATATAGADRIDHSAEGYVPCGTGLQCESNKVKNPCGQSYDKKCLARDDSNVWIGADTIGDKYLVCCSDNGEAASYDLVDDICTLTKPSARNYNPNACTPPNPPKDDPYHATLTINNSPINEKGNLSYKFSGFQPGNIDVWVTKRDQNERTGDIAHATADGDGNGASIIYELRESAGEYTLWTTGSNSISVQANFTIISSSPAAGTSGSTTCSTLAAPTNLACDITTNKISWDTVDGATGYNVRIDNLSNNWEKNKTGCAAAENQNEGDICIDGVIPGTSEGYVLSGGKVLKGYNFMPGTNYHIAVHTVNACGGSVATETDCFRPAPGDTVITLPAGAFNYLFTDTKKAVPELKTSKDQSLTIYLYSSDVDPKNDLRGENAIKKTHESKLSNSEENPLSFNLGQVPAGTYKILLKSPKYLRALEDTRTITSAGGTIILALTKPLANGAGDANGDNSIDILDYNIIQGCIGIRADAICTDREGADVNDDGVADQIDFNVWKTSMSFKDGD